MFQLFSHINNCSSVFNSSLWPWFWLQPVQQWFLVGGHKLTVTFSCIHCNTDFWSTIYVLRSQRFMWPDAFNLNSPVLGLGRIIIINIWYLLLFFDICGLVKQGYWLQRSPQTDVYEDILHLHFDLITLVVLVLTWWPLIFHAKNTFHFSTVISTHSYISQQLLKMVFLINLVFWGNINKHC